MKGGGLEEGKWSARARKLNETDGGKEMRNERGMPPGERTQRLKGWRVAELTDRTKEERENVEWKRTRVR